jgi:hypothetical protein
VSDPMPADRERETEQVETAIASLRAAVVDDNTLAEWFRPGYLLEVANLLDRLRGDAARVDAIESGEIEIECMGTTKPYQLVHGPGGLYAANASEADPRTLREAIDRARSTPGGSET